MQVSLESSVVLQPELTVFFALDSSDLNDSEHLEF